MIWLWQWRSEPLTWMKSILFLFKPGIVGEHVVAFSLLPQVIELDQFSNGTGSNLLRLNHVKILAVQAQAQLKSSTLFFGPKGHRFSCRNCVHSSSSESLFAVVTALEQQKQRLHTNYSHWEAHFFLANTLLRFIPVHRRGHARLEGGYQLPQIERSPETWLSNPQLLWSIKGQGSTKAYLRFLNDKSIN